MKRRSGISDKQKTKDVTRGLNQEELGLPQCIHLVQRGKSGDINNIVSWNKFYFMNTNDIEVTSVPLGVLTGFKRNITMTHLCDFE